MANRHRKVRMCRSRKGFTLVELLVVIGIIAVLISILLPSLARARQQALTIQCTSNMRTIGQALMMYADQNKGFYPYGWGNNAADHDNNGSRDQVYWYATIAATMNNASANPWDTEAVARMTYFKCPEVTQPREFPWTPGSHIGGHPIVFPSDIFPSPMIFNQKAPIPLYKAVWMQKNGAEKAIVWDATIWQMGDAWGGSCFPGSCNVDGDRLWWGSYLLDAPGIWPTWHNINEQISLNGVFADRPGNRSDGNGGDFFRVRHNGGTAAPFLFGDGHAEVRTFARRGLSMDQGTSDLTHRNFAVPVGHPGINRDP